MILLNLLIVFTAHSYSDHKVQKAFVQTKDLREDMADEVDRITQSLKIQNAFLTKMLENRTEETNTTIQSFMKHIDLVLDKMAYVQDSKMEKINARVQEHIYQTEAFSLIIIMDQIDKKYKELADILSQIQELNATIPTLTEKCTDKFTCYECLQDESCGWCSMDDKCVEGDEKGPIHISCNFYSYKMCNGRQCHRYQTCALCISDPSCGWCNDDDRYMAGCLQQPANYQGCPRGGWFHLEGRANSCPSQLAKVYEEEFDENAYWSKPPDPSLGNEQVSDDQADSDFRNAISERNADQEGQSNVEYNKRQQVLVKQIEELEKEAKEIEKEIKKLEKKYEETKNWLKKFHEKHGMEEAAEENEEPEAKQEEPKKTKEELKKEAKEAKAKEKKEKAEKNKKDKQDKAAKAKEEKEKKEKERKEKQKQEQEKKKKEKEERDRKKAEELKRKQQAGQKEEQQQTDEDQNQPTAKKKEKEGKAEKRKIEDDGEDGMEFGSAKRVPAKSSKSGEGKSEKKDSKAGEGKEDGKKEKRDVPDVYFREGDLEEMKFEDLYNAKFIAQKMLQARTQEKLYEDDDELDFDQGDIDDEDDFFSGQYSHSVFG